MREILTNPAMWLITIAVYLFLSYMADAWPFHRRNKLIGDSLPDTEASKLWKHLSLKGCPACGTKPFEMYEGPSGGLSQNVFCTNPKCRQGFNITPMIGIAERIGKATFAYPGDTDRHDPARARQERHTLTYANEQRKHMGKPMLSAAGFRAAVKDGERVNMADNSSWLTWFIMYEVASGDVNEHTAPNPDPGTTIDVPTASDTPWHGDDGKFGGAGASGGWTDPLAPGAADQPSQATTDSVSPQPYLSSSDPDLSNTSNDSPSGSSFSSDSSPSYSSDSSPSYTSVDPSN